MVLENIVLDEGKAADTLGEGEELDQESENSEARITDDSYMRGKKTYGTKKWR